MFFSQNKGMFVATSGIAMTEYQVETMEGRFKVSITLTSSYIGL